MQDVQIIYADEKYISSFYKTLGQVAAEKIYIEMTEPPPFDKTEAFQKKLIEQNNPVYYAVIADQVVGWIDISRPENERLKHRGFLGMGMLASVRGQGIGSKLMDKALEHAKKIGLEKVELSVYTTNTGAIKLYQKFGFIEEGLIKKYRKLGDQYFDCINMAKYF